ncbi:putative baseplate assembly protein [Bradyrhizobium lablabi]|uniref:Putative baseplate assembly protein n=2 Tax=Bradyrhizobium lablabi TaxID=722472 RepID=A0A1M6K9U2_9BRAD|nr:putative baseplate assembly protein [Bradyrhizobium lablabi]
MTAPCSSCAAEQSASPLSMTNRPGLSTLSYRVGNYATFFDMMKGQLSQSSLAGLRTRETSDPAIALLDAWAIVADVLTFYQERIANEGYLRTAVERRSVLELANLVGSSLRPGVSASVNIAYTLEQNSVATIPVGSRVQSLPAQDQLPQSFEISDDLPARGAWSNLAPRLTRPQILTPNTSTVYVAGLTANLKPNDPLLFVASPPALQRVAAVEVQTPQGRTKVDIQQTVPTPVAAPVAPAALTTSLVDLIKPLTKAPAGFPANAVELARNMSRTFDQHSAVVPAALRTLNPAMRAGFFTALKNEAVTPPVSSGVHAFRVKAAPFGHNAPLKPVTDEKGVVIDTEEWPLVGGTSIKIVLSAPSESWRDRDDPALAHIEALFSDYAHPLAFVQIEQGSEKASQSFLIDGQTPPAIGRWHVDASFAGSPKVITLNFTDLGWSCTITFERGNSLIEVSGGGDDIKVPVGRTATSSSSSTGRRLRISTANGIAIEHEAAIAPDPLNVVDLDSVYDQIVPQSWVVIDFANAPQPPRLITRVRDVQKVSVTNYGMSGRVTRLTLEDNWLAATDLMLSAVRPATILAQSELLDLAEEPIDSAIGGSEIELGDLYGDLPSGRWLIVGGERTDIPNTTGVNGAELVLLAAVEQKTQLADPPNVGKRQGERLHTFLELAAPLSYSYKRDTVTVYGNVVSATHGETRIEILGSGNGQPMQQFTLRQGPLTHVKAANPSGTQSTLEVRVNDIPWTEVAALTKEGPFDRCYVTRTDDADKTTIIFGDGVNGMCVPTGKENVKAIYRTGLGSAGNVPTGAISQLATRPFGVKAVQSPLPATGGVDRDGRDQGKANVSLLAATMDRLVSVQDYADFARTFGGVAKAIAALLSDGHRELVHVTVAPADPNQGNSDQYQNLQQALLDAGDPGLPVQVDACELVLLIIAANVGLTGDRQWAEVEADIRSALLGAFGYDRRDLGQDIALSEVIGAIQLVAGVAYVDVTTFDSISTSDTKFDDSLKAKLAAISSDAGPAPLIKVKGASIDPVELTVRSAQIAFLSADLPDTLILTRIAT